MRLPSRDARRDAGRGVVLIDVGAALGDHDDPRVAVARRHRRHHARVGDAQALDAVHAQLGIDDGELVEAHLQEPAWWWYESALARDERVEVVVRVADVGPGHELLADPVGERIRREDLARELHALHEPVAVGLRREVVRVHARLAPAGRRSTGGS